MKTFGILYLFLATIVSMYQATAASSRSLESEIWEDVESDTTCEGCDTILVFLKILADLGNTAFVDTITDLCIDAKADDPDVCKGAVEEEGPIIAQDLRGLEVGSHTSQLFCITFFGLCSFPPVTPYTIHFPTSKPATTRPPVSGQIPIKIVHFSDIHIDPLYEIGASYNCTKPICCRPYTVADAPGNNSYPAGPYGDTHCDAPLSLEESMYAAINSIVPDTTLTLFTGDIVDHAVWLVSEAHNLIDINDAYSRMSNLTQVYGTAGNHEAAPVNSFPPLSAKSATSEQWLYDALSNDWKQWIGENASRQADIYGAYSTKFPGGNLRIISLNTNFYYKENYWMYERKMEVDPSGQLAWLVTELQASENAEERVYIIGHTPFGSGDVFHDASNYFQQIVDRYSATIAGLFFGHTHVDELEIAYSNYSSDYTQRTAENAIEVSYICPSMTPTSGPPAFRVYSVDPVTFGVLDIDTYIANISDPSYQTKPVWQRYYSAKETYGPLVTPPLTDPAAELTPAFWHNVTAAFLNDDAAFQGYISRKSRGFDVNECSGACKSNEICAIRAAESQYNCGTIKPRISFKKRDEVVERALGTVESGICEGSRARPILAKIVAQHGMLEDAARRAVEKYGKKATI